MDLKTRIETVLDTKLVSSSTLGVGFGLTGLSGTTADGRHIAVKAASEPGSPTDSGAQGPHLDIEAFMLDELSAHSSLPVPEVYHAEPSLLIMSWIENDGGGITASVERHAAELLAELHGLSFPEFGYGRDTLIGPLHQPNPPGDNWTRFFRDHRLLHMARAAHDEAALDGRLLGRIELFADGLAELLVEPRHPSLIHGDLWTGNVLVNKGRIGGFVDPAIYCAHPEIELAFTTMFGTFGRAFRYLQSLPDAGSCTAVRRGLPAADRPRAQAARVLRAGQPLSRPHPGSAAS